MTGIKFYERRGKGINGEELVIIKLLITSRVTRQALSFMSVKGGGGGDSTGKKLAISY